MEPKLGAETQKLFIKACIIIGLLFLVGKQSDAIVHDLWYGDGECFVGILVQSVVSAVQNSMLQNHCTCE